MNIEKNDRIGELLTKHIKEMIFDELSEDYLKRAGIFDILNGVPVPIRRTDFDSITVLKIAMNMSFIIGCDPRFKYKENYIAYIHRNFDEKFAEGLIAQGVKAAQDGDLDRAMIDFRAAFQIDPGSADAYYCYGRALKDKYERISIATELEDISQASVSVANDLIGRFKAESIEAFETACSKNPLHAESHYFLGYAYLNMGLYIKAKLVWEEYLKLMDEKGVSSLTGEETKELKNSIDEIKERLMQLEEPVKIEEGYNLILSGKFEEGIRALKPYTESIFKEWWPLWYYLATAYRELGRIAENDLLASGTGIDIGDDSVTRAAYEEAIRYYKEVLRYNPSNRDAMGELADLYDKLGNDEMSLKYKNKIDIVMNNAEMDREMLRGKEEPKLN